MQLPETAKEERWQNSTSSSFTRLWPALAGGCSWAWRRLFPGPKRAPTVLPRYSTV